MKSGKPTKPVAVATATKARSAVSTPGALIAAARAAAFVDEKPERAFAHFRPLAEAVASDGLTVFSGQPLLMYANVKAALDAIEPHLPTALERLRDAELQPIFELPALVMGLEFAMQRVPVATLSAGEIDSMLEEGGPWRELMLRYLEVVSDPRLPLVPQERVRAVRAGSGKLDKAQDFVAIPGLFNEFAQELEGKHPFPAEKIELLATLGAALVQQIRPGNALPKAAKRTDESLLRDRFAALVADRYDHLQVLAAVAVGRRRADALLPALRSSTATASPAAVVAPAAPSPAHDAPSHDAAAAGTNGAPAAPAG